MSQQVDVHHLRALGVREHRIAAAIRVHIEHAALAAEDFTGAMTALAALRAPVDAFFVGVLVNSDVPAERDNRLRLLQQVQSAMGRVADFSLVTG